MYILRTSAAFDSAHFLAGYDGRCANLHGHRWRIEVEAGQTELQPSGEKRGMVVDFGDFKKAVRALIYESGSLRENTLTALREERFALIEVSFRPTAENLAKHFYERLTADGLPVLRVTVYETEDNCAVYTPDREVMT